METPGLSRSVVLLLLAGVVACGGGGGGGSGSGGGAALDGKAAFRLLEQATFGPTQADVQAVLDQGARGWVDAQLAMPSAYDSSTDTRLTHLERFEDVATRVEPGAEWYPQNPNNDSGKDYIVGRASGRADTYQMSVWFENALTAPDQLRQRVAYALSQILVTSASDPQLESNPEALAHYYDILARHAFGNFRDLLGDVARSPAMGIFLSHQGNQKASADGLTRPDENFARELMQLFTIGLYEVNEDGTPRLDGNGELIPTYDQGDIEELAKVMTGWDLRYNNRYGRTNGSFVHSMEFNPEFHQAGSKQVMGNTISDDGAGGDLDEALDMLFNHPNVGPFVGKQLIQRLVTSNPSPAYVGRVAKAFRNNGRGERGDLAAVVRAVLLDDEARKDAAAGQDHFGKAQEPLLIYTRLYRAFGAKPIDGWRYNAESGGVPVNGVFLFQIHRLLGQGALRAESVFNFYDADFVPQDAFYRNANPQRVLPEMQLRTPNNIADLYEATRLGYVLELNDIRNEYGSVAAYVADRNSRGNLGQGNWNGTPALALLDYTPALQAFELAMDGDTNGDYSRVNEQVVGEDGLTPKQRGLHGLLDFLEERLLGGESLPGAFRSEVVAMLDTGRYFNAGASDTPREANRVVSGAVQWVALSNLAQEQR